MDMRELLHNHPTTDLYRLGLRPEGECSACDWMRRNWSPDRDGRYYR